jgi:hypothetical protein
VIGLEGKDGGLTEEKNEGLKIKSKKCVPVETGNLPDFLGKGL